MKFAKTLISAAALGLALATVSVSAEAAGYRGSGGWGYYRGGHHGGHRHWHGGVHWGFGGYWPGYWGGWGWGWPGYWGAGYGYPSTVIVQQEPRIYVEQGDAPITAYGSQQQWWYWCASANGYYPYVSSCTEGWQRVPPQPVQAPR